MSKRGGHPLDESVHEHLPQLAKEQRQNNDIRAGNPGANNIDDELELVSQTLAVNSWDPDSL